MVEAADVLMAEVFQSLDFKFNTGEIILCKNEDLLERQATSGMTGQSHFCRESFP